MEKAFLVGSIGFVGSNLLAAHYFEGTFHAANIADAYDGQPDLLVYAGVPSEMFHGGAESGGGPGRRGGRHGEHPADRAGVGGSDLHRGRLPGAPGRGRGYAGARRFHERIRPKPPSAGVLGGGDFLPPPGGPSAGHLRPRSEKEFHLRLYPPDPGPAVRKQVPGAGGADSPSAGVLLPSGRRVLPLPRAGPGGGYGAEGRFPSRRLHRPAVYGQPLRLPILSPAAALGGYPAGGGRGAGPGKSLVPPPIRAGELYRELRGEEFCNELSAPPYRYDVRTRFGAAFGGGDSYVMTREEELAEIRRFIGFRS